jgi:hypothetical protein
MIPAFYEGQMELALNPEGGEVDAAIGRCFYKCEVIQFLGRKKLTMVTSVSGDSAGNAPPDRWTPAKAGMRRLRYKMEEQQLKKQLNMQTDCPPQWFQWMRGNGGIREPNDLWLVQGLCYESNGRIKQNQGKVEWITPIVFGIPVSAQEDFFEQITTRHNPDEPLSAANNRFGDFCTPEHGRMLEFYKRTKGEGKKKKTEYRVRPGNSVPIAVDNMAGTWMEWEDIIDIPTIERSIELLIDTFDGPAIDYALRESSYYDYVPDEHRGSADQIMNADDIRSLRDQRPQVGYQQPQSQPGEASAPPPPPPQAANVPPPVVDDIPFSSAPPPPAEQVPQASGQVVDPPPPAPGNAMAPTAPPPGVDPSKFQGALEKMGEHLQD